MIAYTHLMEWSHGYESLVSGILFAFDGAIFIYSPIILLAITYNTQVFLWIAFVLNVIAVILFAFFYFPESPVFLLDQGKFEDFNLLNQKLCAINKPSEESKIKFNNLFARYKSQKTERLESRKHK
jgi:hypothetical protein